MMEAKMASSAGLRLEACAALISAVVVTALCSTAGAADPISEQEAQAIAVDAYVYFYPLVTMDVTRRQATNVEPGKVMGRGPANMFTNVPAYPSADFRDVVRPNFDTLYSIAWLDLTKEPMLVSVPDTNGRYYLLPMLNMWSDVFASPGWRTTGTRAAHFLLVPPDARALPPDRLTRDFNLPQGTQRIEAPTPFVWIIGRTKTDGPADYAAVHQIQADLKVTPLSQWGKTLKPVEVEIDPTIDMKTPPKQQVDSMAPGDYFAYAAELIKLNRPHGTDQPIIAQMQRIGIEAGKSFDINTIDPVARQALESAPKAAQQLMGWKTASLARVVNGWSMNTDTMGVYGNYYLKRAIVAKIGLGANSPEDAIYPLNLGDASGTPLDGASKYVLHFAKGGTPPTDAFWSVTLYDPEGFQVANDLNRFAVSSWMPFRYNIDGSLDLYFQNDSPGPDKEANWLPASKGPFNLTMRIYAPKSDALTGRWNPPPVTKVENSAGFTSGNR
jgi:hypothetical protein